jgi:hypothetical protein
VIERRSKRAHTEFNLAAAARAYQHLQAKLCGEQITNPYDLYAVEHLRDKFGLRTGKAVATDTFVFGYGSPSRRWSTKVSGIPFWPRNRPWPASRGTNGFQFLAQFCFLDSRDLARALPGDILLLFVPADDFRWVDEPRRIRFEWASMSEGPPIEHLPKGVKAYMDSEWYGVIHRTFDYPDAIRKAKSLEISQSHELPVLNGTKIGGVPHFIQRGMSRVKGKRSFLCQLASLQAAPNVPYPWTNRKKKMTLGFNSGGIYWQENQCTFGDMGSIFIFIDRSGRLSAVSEYY